MSSHVGARSEPPGKAVSALNCNDVVHWTCTGQGGRFENIAEAENRKAGGKEEP